MTHPTERPDAFATASEGMAQPQGREASKLEDSVLRAATSGRAEKVSEKSVSARPIPESHAVVKKTPEDEQSEEDPYDAYYNQVEDLYDMLSGIRDLNDITDEQVESLKKIGFLKPTLTNETTSPLPRRLRSQYAAAADKLSAIGQGVNVSVHSSVSGQNTNWMSSAYNAIEAIFTFCGINSSFFVRYISGLSFGEDQTLDESGIPNLQEVPVILKNTEVGRVQELYDAAMV
jgi:hypothetical protein